MTTHTATINEWPNEAPFTFADFLAAVERAMERAQHVETHTVAQDDTVGAGEAAISGVETPATGESAAEAGCAGGHAG